ncbi:hypothetical protein GT045_02135 [Streptomyces sp. SID486]|uniref:hypothetical protein n=1 Tax=Streptomyces sp. SID486 TaxID=2690264 RepID=UPI00136F148C|nr:hypothetical protein [Streptomyces sp. SID486]MYX93642.1 hypothetical protein [Streptomyces sp. SID486]
MFEVVVHSANPQVVARLGDSTSPTCSYRCRPVAGASQGSSFHLIDETTGAGEHVVRSRVGGTEGEGSDAASTSRRDDDFIAAQVSAFKITEYLDVPPTTSDDEVPRVPKAEGPVM